MQNEHEVEHNGVRTHKEIPRNTTRFQGIRRNTTRLHTEGALSGTEWCANVQRDSKEYNENPMNTKEYNEMPRNTRR